MRCASSKLKSGSVNVGGIITVTSSVLERPAATQLTHPLAEVGSRRAQLKD